jgi:hypothetical protein
MEKVMGRVNSISTIQAKPNPLEKSIYTFKRKIRDSRVKQFFFKSRHQWEEVGARKW